MTKKAAMLICLLAHSFIWVWLSVALDCQGIVAPQHRSLQMYSTISSVMALSALITSAAFALASDRISPLLDKKAIVVSSPIIFSSGALLISLSANDWIGGEFTLVCGAALAGYGFAVSSLLWGELFALLQKTLIEKLVLGQAAIIALSSMLFGRAYAFDFAVGLLVPMVCIGGLVLGRKHMGSALASSPAIHRRRTKPSPSIIVGCMLICMGIGFLEVVVADSGRDTPMEQTLSVAHLIALALAALLIFIRRNQGYVTHMKAVASAAVLGYLLLPLFWGGDIKLCVIFVQSAHFLLEVVAWLAIADIASFSTSSALKLFGWTRVVIFGGELAGMLLGTSVLSLFPNGLTMSGVNVTVLVAVFAFAIAAIWLLDESKFHAFMWGEVEKRTATEYGAVPEPIGAFADRHGLTQRETEVLSFLAAGRSVPYICEALVISTNTVNSHVRHIYQKCSIHSRQELLTLLEDFA